MTCQLCRAPASIERPCALCGEFVPVCWVCSDGKESGTIVFNHGCTGVLFHEERKAG